MEDLTLFLDLNRNKVLLLSKFFDVFLSSIASEISRSAMTKKYKGLIKQAEKTCIPSSNKQDVFFELFISYLLLDHPL